MRPRLIPGLATGAASDPLQPDEYPSLFMVRLDPGGTLTRELHLPRPAMGWRYPPLACSERTPVSAAPDPSAPPGTGG